MTRTELVDRLDELIHEMGEDWPTVGIVLCCLAGCILIGHQQELADLVAPLAARLLTECEAAQAKLN